MTHQHNAAAAAQAWQRQRRLVPTIVQGCELVRTSPVPTYDVIVAQRLIAWAAISRPTPRLRQPPAATVWAGASRAAAQERAA